MQNKDVNMNAKTKNLLGMARSTAQTKLNRAIIWKLLKKLGETKCYVCGEEMTEEDYTIEHIKPWLNSDSPKELFFDMDNISFSHSKCNRPYYHTKPIRHGTIVGYNYHKCRCELCTQASREYGRKYNLRKKQESIKGEANGYYGTPTPERNCS